MQLKWPGHALQTLKELSNQGLLSFLSDKHFVNSSPGLEVILNSTEHEISTAHKN